MLIARPFVHCCPVLALTAQPVSRREAQKTLVRSAIRIAKTIRPPGWAVNRFQAKIVFATS